MDEGVFWWGQEMGKSNKRHPTEIRFSPFSLLCLLFCWVGVSGLVFYLGILVGRMEQMGEIRRIYEADERAVVEEALPSFSFEEGLTRPDGELEAVSPLRRKPLRRAQGHRRPGEGMEHRERCCRSLLSGILSMQNISYGNSGRKATAAFSVYPARLVPETSSAGSLLDRFRMRRRLRR